jgi:hypothetical protein
MGQAVYASLNGVGCTGAGLYANGLPHASELLLAMMMTHTPTLSLSHTLSDTRTPSHSRTNKHALFTPLLTPLAARSGPRFGPRFLALLAGYENLAAPLFALSR